MSGINVYDVDTVVAKHLTGSAGFTSTAAGTGFWVESFSSIVRGTRRKIVTQ